MIILMIIAAFFLAYAAPDTSIGRICRDRLVTRPFRWVREFPYTLGMLALVTILFVSSATWLLGHDGFASSMRMAPDFLTFATSFEVTSFIEAASSIACMALMTGVGKNMLVLRQLFRRTAQRGSRMVSAARACLKGRNTDDPDPALLSAYA
ncbi:hypothetical protein JK176_01370 [Gluconobacter sp. Dm-73]|uniref:hypothetical protein n=1 Tax=Gluconobacter sp. Dm-73 TaxID=2799802 RepID=UPI001B8BD2AE|nr:hypothetical protein [Gluconobacter sp. Dm-73]MBS1073536.1 hypothetical protein [Gluconobacter sp. Dm-73]